jgi:hypothetical protein
MFVIDLSLLVLLVLLAGFTTLGLLTLDPTRSAAGAVVCGWWATFLAAATTAFVSQVLSRVLLDSPAFFRLAVSSGLEYGLVVGWLPGVAVMAACVLTQPKPEPGWVSGSQGGEGTDRDVAGHPESDDQDGHQPY